MKLTPIDIQQQQFRTAFRGFERRDVQSFLDLVAQQMGELSRERGELQSEVRRTARELEEHREREASLREAMLTAQRAIDEIREQAQKEAQLVVAEAEIRAEKLLHNAHSRVMKILDEISDLRTQRVRLIEALRAVLKTHDRLLDVHEAESESESSDPVASITVLDRVRAPSPPSSEELARRGSGG